MTNFFKKDYEKLLAALNNKKIKTKITYVYILCVLVPTVVTNAIIIGNIIRLSSNEQKENITNISESVAHDISKSLESAVYVTVDLYASNSICNFLDKKYKTQADYYQAYRKVFDNYVFYASSKHLISYITFYSNNPTMINGGKYYRTDTIADMEWYSKFLESNSDLFVYAYYYDSSYINHRSRMISVIRKLNFLGLKDVEKIVKLDLNYDQINEAINSSAFDTTVYVCHDDKIIFTNDVNDKSSKQDFQDVSVINQKKVQAHKTFLSYGVSWDIYVTGYKSNYKEVLHKNLLSIGLLLLADALIPAFMLMLFSNSITKRILLLGRYLEKVKGETFEQITGNEGRDEIGELLENYNLMTLRMKDLIEYELKSKLEQQELILARQQAELLALYSQINPHFIFNVLESIRMHSILKEEDETSRMIESLAKLMRKSAEWGTDYITLQQEIGFMKDYLELQKYRYGEAFCYKIKIGEEFNSYKIPSLVLVTFVENSCVHGLNRAGHYGTIFISAYVKDDYFFLEIEDTGIGMQEDKVQSLEKQLNEASIDELQKTDALGMLNACIRLKKFCGERTKIIIESEPQAGTCIIIKIPIEDMNK